MRTFLSVVAGIVSAFLTTAAIQALGLWPRPADPALAQTSAQEREVRTVIRERVDDRQFAALQREIAELRDQRAAAEANAEAPVPPSPEEERTRLQERFARLEQNHQAEAVDSSWAQPAQANLESGLRPLAQAQGFEILQLDCKTNSCRAEVRWPDFEKANKGVEHLAQTVYPGLNCARHIYAPEPEDPTEAYEAALYLDCSLQRSGQAAIPQ